MNDLINGVILEESQRWLGDPSDTIVVKVRDDSNGQAVSAKGREMDFLLTRGIRFADSEKGNISFFGKWSSYRNRSGFQVKQFEWDSYCLGELEETAAKLRSLLIGRRFPRNLACRVASHYRNQAYEFVSRNPFCLMQFPGVGFKLCDDLYLELGLNPKKLKRQSLCLANDLATNGSGSVWFPAEQCKRAINSRFGEGARFSRAQMLATRSGIVHSVSTDDAYSEPTALGEFQWLASAGLATDERVVADRISQLNSGKNEWPKDALKSLKDDQLEATRKAISQPVGLLIGGGGTGKTYSIARIVQQIKNDVVLMAPTGKAAVRLTEAMRDEGVNLRASTIHSFLYRGGMSEKFVVIDEVSMVDVSLLAKLLKTVPDGTHVLFVGDVYQLSPVGPGAPLRDMLRSLDSAGELTSVRRNAGGIVLAGRDIRKGERFTTYSERGTEDGIDRNLLYVPAKDAEAAREIVLREIETAHGFVEDPFWDVHVLTCVKKRSELGAHLLNESIQKRFNTNEKWQKSVFALGDRIIQTSNSHMVPDRNYKTDPSAIGKTGLIYVANGEMGKLIDREKGILTCHFPNPDRFVKVFPKKVEDGSEQGLTGSSIELAYATTVHKSQGSQWPIVIFVLDDYAGARRMMDRSMVYTAITRAQQYTVIVGDIEIAQQSIKRWAINDRKTFLEHRIREKINGKMQDLQWSHDNESHVS